MDIADTASAMQPLQMVIIFLDRGLYRAADTEGTGRRASRYQYNDLYKVTFSEEKQLHIQEKNQL